MFTYGTCGEILRKHDFAAAPMDAMGSPFGPVNIMQLAYDPAIYRDAPVCIMSSVAQARSAQDPYPAPASVALVVVTTRTGLDLDKIFEKFIGKHTCPTQALPDRSVVRIFARADDEGNMPWPPLNTDCSPIGSIKIETLGAVVALGSPDQWREGINPINTPRSKLALLTADKAMKLLQAVSDRLYAALPPYIAPTPPVPVPILKPGERMAAGNQRLIARLERNGFRPRPYPSASADAGIVLLAKAAPRVTGSADMYGHALTQAGLASVEIRTRRPGIIEALEELMRCDGCTLPVRIAPDGTRLYLMRCEGGPPMKSIEGFRGFGGGGDPTWFRILAQEPVALSAAPGEPDYQWPGTDWAELQYNNLPLFDFGLAQRIERTIEGLCE